MNYDALIIGGGIAGMESALTLGDMGFKVLLIEKESSIGGKMILLSKVFPTLDCASCISTPKMASTIHHPNVTVMTSSEVREIAKNADGTFKALINRRSTYVDNSSCTGCGECETACTVALPDRFNFDMVAHRAAYIPFPQAVPKKAVISRQGQSPCSNICPAGVKAHGYVSLVRSGKYDEAFHLHMEDAPLPGSLSRACYAPCEDECTRGDIEGAVAIRELKRFVVDRYYQKHPESEEKQPENILDKNVAIVGSGPAGLSAAYYLARNGYRVTVFESAMKSGGLLRYGIPNDRLPNSVVERDIVNVASLGVEIRTNSTVTSVKALKEQGFDSVFLALGAMKAWKISLSGEDLYGVVDSMTFLKEVNTNRNLNLRGKTVMVTGSGNAAISPAKIALRLGAEKVIVQYREVIDYRKYYGSETELTHDWEVDDNTNEGVELQLLKTPKRFIGDNGHLTGVESISLKLSKSDFNGIRQPIPVEGSEEIIPVDLVILAIGMRPGVALFQQELDINRDGTIPVNAETLETSMPSVFAGGDVATGPSSIAKAMGQGKRAAFYIDRYLQGRPLAGITFDTRLPVVDKSSAISRSEPISRREPTVL
jgi:NADPH-dependent glutamate synthase beta subunit-like oxidoreductase